jgi:hypothetical protein
MIKTTPRLPRRGEAPDGAQDREEVRQPLQEGVQACPEVSGEDHLRDSEEPAVQGNPCEAMPHHVLHHQQDHPAQAVQEGGRAALPQTPWVWH